MIWFLHPPGYWLLRSESLFKFLSSSGKYQYSNMKLISQCFGVFSVTSLPKKVWTKLLKIQLNEILHELKSLIVRLFPTYGGGPLVHTVQATFALILLCFSRGGCLNLCTQHGEFLAEECALSLSWGSSISITVHIWASSKESLCITFLFLDVLLTLIISTHYQVDERTRV